MPPFRYEQFDSPYTQQIIALMQMPARARANAIRDAGNAQAQAAQVGGQASGQIANSIASAAQHIGQVPQQIQQQKDQAMQREGAQLALDQHKRAAADQQTFDTAMGAGTDREAVLQALPAHLRTLAITQWKTADEAAANAKKLKTDAEAADLDYFGSLAAGVKEWLPQGPEVAMNAAKLAIEHAVAAGHQDAAQLWQHLQGDPAKLPQVLDALIARSPKYAALSRQAEATAESARHNQQTEQQAVTTQTAAATDRTADNTRAEQALTETQRHNRAMEARPVAGAGGDLSNVKEAVAGMRDGTIPSQLPGRASKEYTAMMAEAHRQGYDLSRAATDWTATQKHVATMNGAQQLRLNQAINALPEMLDKADALAAQWKGGRFPALNKANLALAKGGAFGPEVASVANQLDAQVADITADLGNVYMGGNSPTDHALSLAGKSLKGEWDATVFHDMVKLAKTNVQIRKNSINNTGVQGASAENPYAAPPPAQAPPSSTPRQYYDANGNPIKK